MRKLVGIKRIIVIMGVAALGLLAVLPAFAQQGEEGDFCIQDYQTGFTCTANDVPDFEFQIVSVLENCNEGVVGEMEVVVNAVIASQPNRYDLGIFIAQDGGSALTGDQCYHGYLSGGVTDTVVYDDTFNPNGIPEIVNGLPNGWWTGETSDPGDSCGDIESDTEVIVTLPQMRLSCVDNDNDGSADVDVCLSWDNNAQDTCTDVKGAIPGTNSKCGCTAVQFPFTPTAISSLQAKSSSQSSPIIPFAGMVAGLAVVTLFVIARQRREMIL